MKAFPSNARNDTNELRRHAVERVIAAMPEHLEELLSLQDMAEIACMSQFHFNRVFRQITGIPPIQFLYALRLQKAKQILLTTDMTVTDVCYEVGYRSLGTFTSRFTHLVGLSPCRWRRLTEQIMTLSPQSIAGNKGEEVLTPAPPTQCITGHIASPHPFSGLIFIGLFTTPIPQEWPVAGTLLTTPGHYVIGPVADGCYYVFAAAFPQAENPISYLLPDFSQLLVGVSQAPVQMHNGQLRGHIDMTLRPMQLTDPPILIALPALLAR